MAYSVLTSLRGAQGALGLSTRASAGAPPASLGVDGDTHLDTSNLVLRAARSGGAWPTSGVSLRGATGAMGASGTATYPLTSACTVWMPAQGYASAVALSSTPTTLPTMGANSSQGYFYALQGAELRGVTFTITSGSTVSATFRLVDLNNPSTALVVYGPYAAGSINNISVSAGGVVLTAGGRYAWQVSGSGSQPISVHAQYTRPSMQPYGLSILPTMSITTAVTLSSTAQVMRSPGSSTHTPRYGFVVPAYLYQATFTYSASSVTFQLYNETTAAVAYTSPTYSGSGEATIGPFGPGTVRMIAGNNYYWRVLGSGSFTGNVNAQVVQ